MEIGLRFIGFMLLVLKWLTAPFYLIWSFQTVNHLPPISNSILLLSAKSLAKKIRKRELRSEEVVRVYISRLKEVNPHINAVVEDRYADALKDAEEVDKFLDSSNKTEEEIERDTPLLGVPLTVKESCGCKGLSKSVGSLPRSGIKADKDGVAVDSLRRAGAIPLLVSNTPEYSLSWETNNLVTGRTVNPYHPLRTAGGSSGGEAALIGAGASVIGVGSDVAGSIRMPAMFTGVYGHKPTPGYVSIDGHFPFVDDVKFKKYLTIGPITRYAEDLRLMLSIMSSEKAKDLRLDEKVNLKELQVYYMDEAGYSFVMVPVDKAIKDTIHRAAKHLNTKYGIPVKQGGFQELEDSAETSISVFFGLDGIPDALHDYAAMKKTDESQNLLVEVTKAAFGLSHFSLALLIFYCLHRTNALIPKWRYKYYYNQNEELIKKFTNVLGDNGVFLYPTFPTAAFYHNEMYTKTAGVIYTMIFNVMGLPSTHVPLGFNEQGLPIGFQVVAAPHQDRLCLAVAEALEQDLGGWIPPSARNTET